MGAKIAVMIPCYNEAKTIQKVIQDFQKELPDAMIYVYDNNSTDDTAKIATKMGAIVKHEQRQGKGNVMRSMFREIEADCYLVVDGDDTYPAENAKEMCQYILDGKADMVIGDRMSSTYSQENKRRFHQFGNLLMCFLMNHLFHRQIKDVMSGYRTFSKLFVKGCPILSEGFEIETEMTIHAVEKNFKIIEIPVKYRDRKEGSVSKLNTYKDGIRVLNMLLVLFKDCKPRVFFGVIALFFFLLGIILNVPPFLGYFQTGKVERFPSLIVGGALMIMGLLNWVTGIILEVIVNKNKQQYLVSINILDNQLKR